MFWLAATEINSFHIKLTGKKRAHHTRTVSMCIFLSSHFLPYFFFAFICVLQFFNSPFNLLLLLFSSFGNTNETASECEGFIFICHVDILRQYKRQTVNPAFYYIFIENLSRKSLFLCFAFKAGTHDKDLACAYGNTLYLSIHPCIHTYILAQILW